MDLNEIQEVIATRELSLDEPQGIRKVTVSLGKPEPFPEAEGYCCPFQILGIGSEKVKYAAGIDAVQALQLVMVMIGATLQFLAKEIGGNLQWDGNSPGDFGFPISNPE
jgi:hypothetical protein